VTLTTLCANNLLEPVKDPQVGQDSSTNMAMVLGRILRAERLKATLVASATRTISGWPWKNWSACAHPTQASPLTS
jgi:hypothetical protein